MKKKLIAFTVLIVVVLTMCLTLSGCDMFKLNSERDYNQVIATVSYKGMTKDIVKGELQSYVTSYGAAYMQNYSMTLEDVVDYFYNTLSRQALLTLMAKEYIYTNDAQVNALGNLTGLKLEQFLTSDELRYCVEQTNSQFQSSFDSQVETLIKEATTEEEDKEEDTSDLLEARTQRTKEEESTEYEDKGFTAEYIAANFDGKTVSEYLESIRFFNTIDSEIKKETDSTKRGYMKSALKTLRKNLDTSYLSYDYFYNQQLESRIVDKYRDKVGDAELAAITDAEIAARYTKLVDSDKNSYKRLEDYSSALEKNTFTYYNLSNKYFGVKSILLKFSDDQTNAISYLSSIYGDTDLVKSYRDLIATGYGVKTEEVELMNKDFGIKVNVSNPDYDAEEDSLKDAYTDLGINYLLVVSAMADDIAAKVNAAKTAASNAGITGAALTAVEKYAYTEAFTDWIYLVNDDSGMFSSDTYLVTPDGKDTSFVEEYTVLARELYKTGINSIAIDDSTSTAAGSEALAYEGETKLFTGLNGTTSTVTVKNCTSTVETGDDLDLEANVYTLTTQLGNKISFIVNTYGIHIVMVEKMYGVDTFGIANSVTTETVEGEEVYTVNDNYIYEYEVNIEKDEDGNITKVTSELKDVNTFIKETISEEKKSDMLTTKQIKLFLKDAKEEDGEVSIDKVDKIINQLIKDFSKNN